MNDKNLIPFNERTEEEQREIRSKGGIASAEKRRKRKTLKEELELLLEIGDTQKNGCLAIIEKFMSGDIKAFETIRDTVGEKPTEKREFVGELPPLVVRELKTNDKSDGDSDTVSAADNETLSE